MGKIELDHTGSGSGITLSSDGTDLLLDGTAIGGGADLYAANESSPDAQPTATGANAVAIGDSAEASGADSFVAGYNATAYVADGIALGKNSLINTSGSRGVAIGYSAEANVTGGLAVGYQAQAATGAYGAAFGYNADGAGQQSVALGNSRAFGTLSLAAVITSNSSSYGASGAYGVAIGQLAKATATNSIAIGDTATSTTANQIALGGTTDTVKISGAYTLPTSDGTANQVLTTDGAGAVTFADAGGGGADLYAAETTSATDPTASGTRSIAIGSSASATGTQSVAIGESATASGANSVSIGRGTTDNTNDYSVAVGYFSRSSGEDATALGRSSKADGLRSTALGYNADANGSYSLAVGKGSLGYGSYSISIGADTQANYNYSTALGHNSSGQFSRADAVGSIALNGSRTGGTDSFAAAIANNTSTYGATGANSVAIGRQAKATGSSAHAFGSSSTGNIASGNNSFAIGTGATASATGSRAMGNSVTADGYASIAKGAYGDVNGVQYRETYGFGSTFQRSIFVLQDTTSDATATILSTNGNAAAISATTQITLPNNSAYSFSGTIVARESATDGTDCAAWEVKGLIRREGSASTTTLVNSAITVIDNSPSWGLALSADTTNGCLKVQATGAASTNIRWVATIHTSEVTYA